MCLYIRKHIKSTDKPIIVQKVLVHDREGNWFSPYHRFPYNLYEEYKTDLSEVHQDGYRIADRGFFFFIDKVSKNLAQLTGAHVFRCEIPQGAEIYIGIDSSGLDGIVANKFRFIKD